MTIDEITQSLFDRFGNLVVIDDYGNMIEQEDGEVLQNKKIAEFLLSIQQKDVDTRTI